MKNENKTSWEKVGAWYDKIVGSEGHYYHQKIIIPGVLKLLQVESNSRVLDMACGQGILARHLPKEAFYLGVDASTSLIKAAKHHDRQKNHQYLVADATQTVDWKEELFTHGAILLALQNIAQPMKVLQNFQRLLVKNGKLAIILNHPCFRIPRQSSWQIDEQKKIQYRRIDRYLSPLEIPIQAHPSQREESPHTFSYHNPLSTIFSWLQGARFAVTGLEEWCSDKQSTGKAAKMENRARKEFPLFLALSCIRLSTD